MLNNNINYLIVFFISFIICYLSMRDKPDSNPKIGFNFVLVKNPCENKCYHIHHWFYLGILLIIYFLINLSIGYGWNIYYIYIISIYMGLSFAELVKFGNDIFKFNKPCCFK